ncbi:MAG: hypothetical protein WBV69_16560 [Candidatus Sulfotelmatobacter sp.]
MEALKIFFACTLAAILYGIVHDQITARICVEYFTVFHPPIFHTQSPTLLALGWGVIATWWVGAFFSVPLIFAARAGSRTVLRARDLINPILLLLGCMAASAILFGAAGYLLARSGALATDWLTFSPFPAVCYRFMADLWAHSASYACAILGGVVLCVVTYRRRPPMHS